MQGVMEEKTNRIIEIMISSVKPFDLMMGKIIGIGFVGLTQVFLWAVMTFILITGGTFFLGGGMESEILQSSMALNTTPNMTVIAAQQPANEWIEMLHTINFTEIGILFIAYFRRLLIIFFFIRRYRISCRRPRRHATIHATSHASFGFRPLCGDL